MKIPIAGTGYVDLSLAELLSQQHEEVALDVIQEKVDLRNAQKPPIHDNEILDFLDNKVLISPGTLDKEMAYKNVNFVIIATPIMPPRLKGTEQYTPPVIKPHTPICSAYRINFFSEKREQGKRFVLYVPHDFMIREGAIKLLATTRLSAINT